MSDIFVVTVDGPAGVGKSTISKRLAEDLGIAYLDTGAMFRLLGLEIGRRCAGDFTSVDSASMGSLLENFSFSLDGAGENTRLYCNGKAIGLEVRSEEAAMMAARLGAVPQAREFLKTAQRKLGEKFSLLAEGRDMGTVVFPKACCKFFLDASPEVRAQRRFLQLQEMQMPVDYDLLLRQIRDRDDQDRNRAIAPLRPAEDAVLVDTSLLGLEEVFSKIVGMVRSKMQAA